MQMQTHVHMCTHTGAVFVTYGNDGAISGDSGRGVAGGHSNCVAFRDTLRREFW